MCSWLLQFKLLDAVLNVLAVVSLDSLASSVSSVLITAVMSTVMAMGIAEKEVLSVTVSPTLLVNAVRSTSMTVKKLTVTMAHA